MQKKICNKIFFIFISISIMFLSLFLTSCGKHEEKRGTVGTIAGAAVGAAVSSNKSRGSGTLLGALVGNYLGRSSGRNKDKKVKINNLEAENRSLHKKLIKFCESCNRESRIDCANSCASCGLRLIQEKFCTRCNTIFLPQSGYNYCPYCSVKVALKAR